ncbi:hypothetical protein L211DRAFT_852927 [Terfezia boudieri ATCC MYA-4762]|uniref:Uncharacterized protein n=1 Tax=Terfezia boudieri ATCC MYA-4762 TaxID=1051890 RepID=A0A3N4LA07_9PEZI|nr:hypothetical protein L211DRAFT_852927 [Terfezia boudieri ATCC MYA-4762]
MQGEHESFPRPPGITSQMTRHENGPPTHDGAEGGPAQSSSLKYRQENLRPIRPKFLCDAHQEGDTQIIGRAPGPQKLPTLTPSERGKTVRIPSSMWDTTPVHREIKALITPYNLLNQLPMASGTVSNTTQGEYGKPTLAQPNEASHKEYPDVINGEIGTEQVPEELQASVTQGNLEKQERKGKGKTPMSKETQDPQQAKGSKDGISKASTVGPSSYHDTDARMCPPQRQSINRFFTTSENPLSATKQHNQCFVGEMQDKHESFPRPPGITSQMSRHENTPQTHDGAEVGPPQSSSLKYRQENLRPIRRKFLCDAHREADTQIIGRTPGPQKLPTLLVKTPSERGKTVRIPSSMWDTTPVFREIKALITPYNLLNQLPMTVSNTTQGEYGKPPLAQLNEAAHKEYPDVINGEIGTEQVPDEVQVPVTQGNQEKHGRKGKGKTPVPKETQESQQAKGSKDGISKASTATQNTGLETHMQQGVVSLSSYHDMDTGMCLPQGQRSNQGTQGQPEFRPAHDQFRTPAPNFAMQPQQPFNFNFHAQPPKRDFRVIFPDLNPSWFNDEGLIQLPPLRRRQPASPPNPPSDIGLLKAQFHPTS